jgi:hypothetical protein
MESNLNLNSNLTSNSNSNNIINSSFQKIDNKENPNKIKINNLIQIQNYLEDLNDNQNKTNILQTDILSNKIKLKNNKTLLTNSFANCKRIDLKKKLEDKLLFPNEKKNRMSTSRIKLDKDKDKDKSNSRIHYNTNGFIVEPKKHINKDKDKDKNQNKNKEIVNGIKFIY